MSPGVTLPEEGGALHGRTQAALQRIRLREPKIDRRWGSGQFSESSSKGKGGCDLTKPLSPKEHSVPTPVNGHALQPRTVQSFRNLTKGPGGFVEASHRAEWTKGRPLKGLGGTAPLLAMLTRQWQLWQPEPCTRGP